MKNETYAIIIDFHSKREVSSLSKNISPLVSRIIIIDNSETNRGFSKAVNLGVKQAIEEGATQVLLINPDINISRLNLEVLLNSNFDIAAPVLTFKRNKDTIYDYGGKVNFFLGRPTHLENRKSENIDFVSGACMLIKTDVFKKIGYFDERFFMYFEDVDFCLRAKRDHLTVGVVEDSIVGHSISEHKVVKNSDKEKYILTSNYEFIKKWVPWYFSPFAFLYLSLLKLKT